jgi:uncharacterized protein (TIGR03435 family)
MMRMLNKKLCSLLVAVTCLLAALAPISSSAGAQKPRTQNSNAPQKEFKFEVFSIRPSKPGGMPSQGKGFLPNGYQTINDTMWQTIMHAYNTEPPMNWGDAKLLNAPKWVTDDFYNIEARVADRDMPEWQKQSPVNPMLLRSALQAALKERCKLSLHEIPSEISYLNLVVGKHGLKIKETVPGESFPNESGMSFPGGGKMIMGQRDGIYERRFYGVTMYEFAVIVSGFSGSTPVQDKTGLTGRYDFVWQEQDNPGQESDPGSLLNKWPVDSLGLALKPGKGPSHTFVIDHIEKPSPN